MGLNITNIFIVAMCITLIFGVLGLLLIHIYYKHKTLRKIKEIAYLYEHYKKEIQEEIKKDLYKKENK